MTLYTHLHMSSCTLMFSRTPWNSPRGVERQPQDETSNISSGSTAILRCISVCFLMFGRASACVVIALPLSVAATEKVAIPAVSETGVVSKWSELDGVSGSKAIERVKNRDYDGSLYMVNKPPRWNDQVCAVSKCSTCLARGVVA